MSETFHIRDPRTLILSIAHVQMSVVMQYRTTSGKCSTLPGKIGEAQGRSRHYRDDTSACLALFYKELSEQD